MPVPAQPRVNRHTGNGVTDTWAYGFRILNKLDIGVDVDGALLTVDVDYTVTDVGEANGGTIVFVVPPANLAKITLYSNAAYARTRFDYVRNGSFKEETVDADFDQLTILIQQIDERFGRGLSIPISDSVGTNVQLPSESDRAGMILTFDAMGNVTVLAPADIDLALVSPFIATLLDDLDAEEARATLGAGDFLSDGSVSMTGALVLSGNASSALHAVPKQQLDTAIASVEVLANRNLLINACGRVNQRGYVSGTATGAANRYTLDRWRVVVSGQSLVFTADGAIYQLTAPAGGVEQPVEGSAIEGGNYVLDWQGTATATVNGTAVSKGVAFTLAANTDAIVRFSSGTVLKPVLIAGNLAGSYTSPDLATEIQRCQRFYEVVSVCAGMYFPAAGGVTQNSAATYAAQKRALPTLTNNLAWTGYGVNFDVLNPTTYGFAYGCGASQAGYGTVYGAVFADAEIY